MSATVSCSIEVRLLLYRWKDQRLNALENMHLPTNGYLSPQPKIVHSSRHVSSSHPVHTLRFSPHPSQACPENTIGDTDYRTQTRRILEKDSFGPICLNFLFRLTQLFAFFSKNSGLFCWLELNVRGGNDLTLLHLSEKPCTKIVT